MTLGEKISIERKNKGFSQELLAENSGISVRTIQRIENDKSTPRPYTLKVIADTLEIDIENIVSNQTTHQDEKARQDILSKINLINSSALLGLIIPFLNIIVPVIIWRLNKANPIVNEKGKKIISFQVLWFLFTIIMVIVTHFLHYQMTGGFVSGRIPVVVVIYILLLLLNVFFIVKSSLQLKKEDSQIYSFIPTLF